MTDKKEVFREELVLSNYEAKDAEDVFRALADKLFEDGSVKDNYFQAMYNRERSYPTGLPTEEIHVAIHTQKWSMLIIRPSRSLLCPNL